MAINYKPQTNNARKHSDKAKDSSDQDREELFDILKVADAAAEDLATRRKHRAKGKDLSRTLANTPGVLSKRPGFRGNIKRMLAMAPGYSNCPSNCATIVELRSVG